MFLSDDKARRTDILEVAMDIGLALMLIGLAFSAGWYISGSVQRTVQSIVLRACGRFSMNYNDVTCEELAKELKVHPIPLQSVLDDLEEHQYIESRVDGERTVYWKEAF